MSEQDRRRSRRQRRPPAGSDPSFLALGEGGAGPIRAIRYGPDRFAERHVEATEVPTLFGPREVLWLDLTRPDAAQLSALARTLDLHPLAVADVAHPPQRPKYAPYARFNLFILRHLGDGEEESTQVGLFVGEGWVLTVRETERDPFRPVYERLRDRVGQIRERGAGWLAAALIATVVDGYFEPVEDLREAIEELEDAVLLGSEGPFFGRLHALRRRLLLLRRAVEPTLEAVLRAVREQTPRWEKDALLHLREAGADASQLLEAVEAAQASAAALGDLYLSVLSSRTNGVVTVLTLVSTIFLPMSFLAGVWGMNFWYMPELRWRWGYLAAWIALLLSGLVQLFYFHRRGWFRNLRPFPETERWEAKRRRRRSRHQ